MNTFTPKGHIRGPIMPIQILKSCELSLGAKILYNALIYFAGEKNFCWAAHSTFAKFICCSVSSIKNYLNELKIVGLIRVEKGSFGVCRYYFLRPSWVSDSFAGDDTPKQGGSGHNKPESGAVYPEKQSCETDYGYKFNGKNLKQITPLPP